MTARKRKTGESYKAYRANLKAETLADRQRCRRGRLIWDATNRGPYCRRMHGHIGRTLTL